MTANTLASSLRRLTTPQTHLLAPAEAPMTCRPFFTGGILVILTAGAFWGAWLLWQIGFAGSFTALSIHRINAHGHAQIFGWVGLFIMGFGSQMFPWLWNTRRAWPVLLPLSFALMIVGLLLCTPAIALPELTGAAQVALLGGVITTLAIVLFTLQMVPWLMLAAGIFCAVWPWRLWRPPPQGDRSAKFIRTAYGWLALSLVMLLLLPLHPLLSGLAFSHAYYGAIRHAITVGFVSLMIMGMAPWLVASMRRIDTRTLSGLWGPFILVNIGCLLRVALQSATDFTPIAFGLIGVSGVLEVAGLAWWSAHLLWLLLAGDTGRSVDEAGNACRSQPATDQRLSC